MIPVLQNLQFYEDTNSTAEPKYDTSRSKYHLVSSGVIFILVGIKFVGTEKRGIVLCTGNTRQSRASQRLLKVILLCSGIAADLKYLSLDLWLVG